MTSEKEAAIEFIKFCRQIYPETDMMDEEMRMAYDKCWSVLQQKSTAHSKKAAPKVKKKGKLQLFEDQVFECLEQGFGEEQQLLEEAEARRNKYARKQYIEAYNRAVRRFNQQRGDL